MDVLCLYIYIFTFNRHLSSFQVLAITNKAINGYSIKDCYLSILYTYVGVEGLFMIGMFVNQLLKVLIPLFIPLVEGTLVAVHPQHMWTFQVILAMVMDV